MEILGWPEILGSTSAFCIRATATYIIKVGWQLSNIPTVNYNLYAFKINYVNWLLLNDVCSIEKMQRQPQRHQTQAVGLWEWLQSRSLCIAIYLSALPEPSFNQRKTRVFPQDIWLMSTSFTCKKILKIPHSGSGTFPRHTYRRQTQAHP